MADKIVIRPVGKDERAAWEPLWDGYIAFYKATLEPGASDVAWQRFHDPDEPMFLLGAYVDGKLTGIVQYLFHRSTWAPGNYCYLQDLFVSDGARGLGVGRARRCGGAARANGSALSGQLAGSWAALPSGADAIDDARMSRAMR